MKINLSPERKVEPKKGKILLSEPFMDDPHFSRTVILLCEHSEKGSFGFVLNKYLDIKLEDVLNGLPGHSSRISLGGPVHNNSLYYIHTLGEILEGSIEVIEGIYMGADFEELKEMLRNGQVGDHEVRFFQGCSGWSPSQLEHELKEKSWFVAKVDNEIIMNTHISDLWQKIMKSMGTKGHIISNTPADPSLN